ncbi:MAG: ABC transporter permease subunit [Actinobacteria bacterium]|nr:ABC transporter permease subunit [Actinomycetota bacterium]
MVRRIAVLVIVATILLPLVPLVIQSVAHGYVFPQLVPAEWSTRAWSIVLATDGGTWEALAWSLAVAATVTALSLLVAVPAGRVLGLRSFRGRRVLEFLVLTPLLVPAVAVGIGLDITFIRLGLSGTFWGVVLVHLIPAAPYAVLILAGVFANYDEDFEVQARTLGADPLSVFRHVTMPAIMPGLVVAGFFAFIVSWSQYVLTLQIGGGKVLTLPVLLVSTASGGDVAITGALTIVYALPVVVLLVVTSRHLVRAGLGARGT